MNKYRMIMQAQPNKTDGLFDLSILTMYKLIEYVDLLKQNPKGLSRTEIREKLPISSTPEMNCTETLFKAGFITNAKILKGKKFKLTEKGKDFWNLIQTVDSFIKHTSQEFAATDEELERIETTIQILSNYKGELNHKRKQLDNLNSLF